MRRVDTADLICYNANGKGGVYMDRIIQMISYGIAVAVVTMAVRLVLIPRKGKETGRSFFQKPLRYWAFRYS